MADNTTNQPGLLSRIGTGVNEVLGGVDSHQDHVVPGYEGYGPAGGQPAASQAVPVDPNTLPPNMGSSGAPAWSFGPTAPASAADQPSLQPRPGQVAAGVDPNGVVTPLPPGGIPGAVAAPAGPVGPRGSQVPVFGLGLQSETTQNTGGLDLSKTQALKDKAIQTQQDAEKATVDAQISQNQFTAEASKQVANQKAADTAEIAAQNQDFDERRQVQADKVSQAADALKNSKTVNPWADASLGAKVAAGIAVGFGALGSAYTGQPNAAYGIINDAVNRDVQIQQQNAVINEKAYGAAKDTYGIIKGMIGDEQQATLLMQKQRLDQVGADLQSKLDTTKDAQAKAQGMTLLGQIQAGSADKQQQIDQLTSARTVSTQQKGVMPTDANGKPIYVAPAEIQARTVNYPNGQQALAPSSGAADKIRDHIAATTSLNDSLNRLIALRQKYGVQVIPSSEKAQVESASTELKAKLKESLGFKALTDTDEKLIEGMTGGDANQAGFVLARLQELKHGVNNDSGRFLSAQGVPSLGANSGAAPVTAGTNQQGFALNTPAARGQAPAAGE